MPDHNPKFGHIRPYVLYFLAMTEEVFYRLLAVAFGATILWVLRRGAINGANAESIVEANLELSHCYTRSSSSCGRTSFAINPSWWSA